uniref:SSD domain-containing protein n=1 Tax=Meloidogyne incognita TaxID=6306 RepID=A0A914M8Q2_MELIC
MEEKSRKTLLPDIFGDVELNSFQHVHSLIMRIKLKRHLKPQLVDTFERHLRRIISNFSRQNSLTSSQEEEKPLGIHFWSAQQLAAEIENSLRQTHVKVLICWVALCGILAIVQIRSSTYESRPMVGVQQALTLLLASICAYAVHLASSERFNSLLFALPFTLASIGTLTFAGVDSAFERYSGIAMHPTEKMAFLFIWDGCALVLLPLLWLILLCFFSSLLVQSIFLLQSLLSLAAGFSSLLLFSLTFLLVCWLGTARRMAAGLKWFQICRTGDQSFNEKQFFDYDAYTCARLHEKLADLRPCFGRRFGHLVCGQNFRMLSFGLFCILCIGAIIGGITTNKNNTSIVKLEASHFLLPKSQSQLFIENFHLSFPKYEDFIEINFDGPLDYEERKEQIFALLNWPIEIGLANKAVSWLIEFEKFKKTVAYRVDEESSVSLLTHVFLRDERYNKFLADLHVSQGQIHKSRMYLKLTSKGRQQSEFLIRSILEKAKRASFSISLHVPFSFSITHDIQVIPKMFTSILWLCTLSAILSALQPSLAICLFVSNLFLSASVNTCFYLFNIPLNVVTLGILAVFGLPLNSACILHFSHHFFNSGPLQQNNYLRIQYAFQCSLWPICLATIIGPLTFCFELIFGTYPPIVFNVFQILTICSLLIFIQIFVFLPSLLPMFSDLFHDMFTIASQLCDENANAEMTVDPMSENVYFVRRQQPICPTSSFNRWQAAMGYGYHQTFNIGGAPTNLCIPPAYKPPPLEYYPFKPQQNNNFILHSRQTSRFSQQDQNINSPRINSSCGGRSIHTDPKERSAAPPPPIYSPPNMRKDNIMINGCCCSKTDSGHNSFSEVGFERKMGKRG